MADYSEIKVLGIIAGAGEFPRLVAEGARRAGIRVVCGGMRGAVNVKEMRALCDAFRDFRVGSLEAPRKFFEEQGVTHVMLTGQIKPACIYTMWPDATARRYLATLDRRNAHTIFGAVCEFIESTGMRVLPSTTFLEQCLPAEGHLAGPELPPNQLEDARHGLGLAREIARLDIGQSIVVQGRKVVCVEAFKGTNECIKSGGGRPEPVTLCKVTKPGHDMRFDVPCIGPTTIKHCHRCHVNTLVFEAERTIIFQRAKVEEMCREYGISLYSMVTPVPPVEGPEPGHPEDDAAHAVEMALELERLGIGHCAAVCDGVVIAVDDADGPLKCIRRAGEYMSRLRWIRLFKFLCSLLPGRKREPVAPMVLRSTPGHPLTEAELRAARQAGMQAE